MAIKESDRTYINESNARCAEAAELLAVRARDVVGGNFADAAQVASESARDFATASEAGADADDLGSTSAELAYSFGQLQQMCPDSDLAHSFGQLQELYALFSNEVARAMKSEGASVAPPSA